jgi:hypothetical protein
MPVNRPKRIFVLANLVELTLETLPLGRQFWVKGLIRSGCDVQTFSYRNMMVRRSPVANMHVARLFFKRRVDELLVSQIKRYCPDMVLVTGMRLKDVGAETLVAMHRAAPGSVFVGAECDWLAELDPIRKEVGKQMDIVLATSGGSFLRTYKALGIQSCAFMPNPCDPDLHYRYEVADNGKVDILFTGKAHNRKMRRNAERYELLARLSRMPNARLYGCLGNPPVQGLDYYRAISGARVALSINMVNDVRLYHSDRFIQYIACGAFTLAKRVPDTDLLFEDGVHVRYFDEVDEFFELAQWYLAHDAERERIAQAGMDRAHREFNCERIAGHLLDLVEKGRIDAPWAQIV